MQSQSRISCGISRQGVLNNIAKYLGNVKTLLAELNFRRAKNWLYGLCAMCIYSILKIHNMIQIVDFIREYKSIKKEIDSAINRVLRRGVFVLGPEVENFEKNFAKYCGVKYAVGVASGTDALYLSLLALDIGRGDEVIVPVNTALATAMAVKMSGAKPVFCDSDENFLIDINKIPALINKRTKAIMPVHLYGRACDMEKLRALAKAHKLFLIEDCAQAHGAVWNGKKVGGWGDFSCFSFYPTKNLGAYGDGGAVTTNSEGHYKKLRALRFYGAHDRVTSAMFGINSRLDEKQAAILSVKLKYLDKWNQKRKNTAKLYGKLISNKNIILPKVNNENEHVYHLFVARAKNRDSLMKVLKKKNIQTLIHYPLLLHNQPIFNYKGRFANAEKHSKEIFSLPMHPFLKKEEVAQIAKILNA
ncbi:MAG: Glutamine-scyllo-inositol transaminase [Candidatus Giovannonibacteria bacterium GW2011_GWC2_44_9]|uniref:Glutamine-scyllo-inositol transaminase n=3 Tax=Candidatus Giovannoniibacteriota TaxID=1752738 RepID=A0A0G1IZ32_9BACT|nr:MAG: Glutamine-scyllo-inositol transaminase [Candidatus Giovannonibacteria bacterium GW2011_GWB1_44_23]KKT64310.1 MAG: Glutamine-scyllo-inositol transaminase [Candidatus Giovannonibacteria bacterium GW2011_GWA1_44_29]KKT84264.1 MAG: Glutamine-scyllo-inositol transaminase [Candidatus Giovannonibacteria bacterium GW2011_GWC2_44_9]KKT92037.1 MAG: Glutamine-scyllo-inositol transaminase [Parcubacteria group bacterium GW2011_GWC1_45_13]